MRMQIDGTHIKALLLAYFGRFAQSLIKTKKIHFLKTPLITVKKKGVISDYFFDFESFNKAKIKSGQITYYKGLGTWDPKDLKEIIKKDGLENFIITFEWDEDSKKALDIWVGSDADLRKTELRGTSFLLNAV